MPDTTSQVKSTDIAWQSHIARQEALVGTTQQGVILLGDISGYTRLITRTDLEHARNIMQFLFEEIYSATGEEFLVNEIEGDAIFAYCVHPKNPAELLAQTIYQIKEYGHAFYHAQKSMLDGRELQEADGKACTCQACSNIGTLSFKFVIHYGDFGVNKIGPFVKLVGGSVIVAHRLLKNSVPGNEYVLLTKEALDHLPAAERAKFTPMVEEIEHFGDVETGYRVFNWEAEDAKHHGAAKPTSDK